MLLIVPVRPEERNEELRYALRSWETNLHLGSDLGLLVVGHCPTWLEPDHFVPGNKYTSVPLAVFDNVRLGAQEAVYLGHDQAIVMNDDFFCLDPTGAVLPVKRDCTLAEHIALFPTGANLWWPRSLALTASWLASEGFPHPDSYEVHRPLYCKPDAMVEALHRWPQSLTDMVPQWRTVYGTLAKVDAYPVTDVKLGMRVNGVGSPWISTSDESWRRYSRGIIPRFRKPSRWELH